MDLILRSGSGGRRMMSEEFRSLWVSFRVMPRAWQSLAGPLARF